jgi:hypothetical protein
LELTFERSWPTAKGKTFIRTMDPNFETRERADLPTGERFRDALIEKGKTEIKQLVQKRIEQYYREHVDQDRVNSAATRIFDLILQGVAEHEIERELVSAAADILKERQ